MSSAVVALGTALLVFVTLLLKMAIRVLMVLAILVLIGLLYPYVARALGLPYATVYGLVSHLWSQTITISFQ